MAVTKKLLAEVVLLVPINHLSNFLPSLKKHPAQQRESIGISSRKFENFELFCPLGAMKLGVQHKKLLHLIQPSQDSPCIYFFESGVTGTCKNGDEE